jgi:mono/diheme cytochrome c family protein
MIKRSLLWRGAASAGLTLAASIAQAAALSGEVTFTKDVLPILQKNCQECHRPSGVNLSGMVAPMSLMTYDEARPWAKSIGKMVSERKMPPWFASSAQHGQFELERGLTQDQVDAIVRWTETGAKRGDPKDAPDPVEFASPEGWLMGVPDIVIPIPEPYWVADEIEDIQPSFDLILTDDMLAKDEWVKWIEFRPGCKIIHHGGASTQPLDANGKAIVDPISGGKLIGTAQGDGPDVWPEGFGKLVRKNSRFSFGIHYNKEPGPGTGVWDRSMIAIKWQTAPVKHVVRSAGVSSRGWEIPPNTAGWPVGAAKTFAEDSYIINMMPHMHWRGSEAKYELIYPDGKRETLLEVPRYDFAWQTTYTYKEPKFVPAGSRLEVTMTFDNSPQNGAVLDPERAISFGSMTKDEMNIGWTEYANADPIEDLMNHDFGAEGTGVEDLDPE